MAGDSFCAANGWGSSSPRPAGVLAIPVPFVSVARRCLDGGTCCFKYPRVSVFSAITTSATQTTAAAPGSGRMCSVLSVCTVTVPSSCPLCLHGNRSQQLFSLSVRQPFPAAVLSVSRQPFPVALAVLSVCTVTVLHCSSLCLHGNRSPQKFSLSAR